MPVFTEAQLNFLPKKARAKAIALDEQRDAAAAAMKAASADLEEAWQRRDAIERDARNAGQRIRTGTVNFSSLPLDRLRELIAAPSEEDRVTPLLAKVELEIAERIKPRLDRARAAFDALAVADDAALWLNDAIRAGVRLADAPAAKIKNGDYLREVERIRGDLEEIERRFELADSAPLPLASIREAIVAEIDEIAERGRPTLSFVAREVSPLRLDRALGTVASKGGPRLAETVAWAVRDVLVDRALAIVGDTEPENALTDQQRDAALEKLAAERLEAERTEEALIVAAASVGTVVARRREADPRALLEIVELSAPWRSRHDLGVVEI